MHLTLSQQPQPYHARMSLIVLNGPVRVLRIPQILFASCTEFPAILRHETVNQVVISLNKSRMYIPVAPK
jgi:hypothetical protein